MARNILEPLRPVAGHPHLLTARKGAARMMAVQIPAGGLALYSPIPDPDDDAIATATALGRVAAIIAPSPFHHLGIASWRAAFPKATIHALPGAAARLEKRLGSVPLTDMPSMPEGIELLSPSGLKAPEVWLRSEGTNGIAWAVCDAFAGPAGADEAPAETPKARGAFATTCIGDKADYKGWAMTQIDRDHPALLLPAHGNAVAGESLPDDLRAIVETL